MPVQPRPDSQLAAALAAATSPEWTARVQSAQQLAAAAGQPGIAQALLTLLLDAHDTAVTDATCHALLNSGDIHAIRLIAQAVAIADDEHLDHLYGILAEDLLPDGSVHQLKDRCHELAHDPDPAVRNGTRQLIAWTDEWNTGRR